jgi:hypothetical protein
LEKSTAKPKQERKGEAGCLVAAKLKRENTRTKQAAEIQT